MLLSRFRAASYSVTSTRKNFYSAVTRGVGKSKRSVPRQAPGSYQQVTGKQIRSVFPQTYPRVHPLLLSHPEWRSSQCWICLLDGHRASECEVKTIPNKYTPFLTDLPLETAVLQRSWLLLNAKAAGLLLDVVPSDFDLVPLLNNAGLDPEMSIESMTKLIKIFVEGQKPQVEFANFAACFLFHYTVSLHFGDQLSIDALYLLQCWNQPLHPLQISKSFNSRYRRSHARDVFRSISVSVDASTVDVLCLLASTSEAEVTKSLSCRLAEFCSPFIFCFGLEILNTISKDFYFSCGSTPYFTRRDQKR